MHASDPPPTDVAAKPPGLLKRLYLWVLHWAETPYGTPALFLLSFAESSFFPIPPDVLQIALSVSKPKRSFYYAAVSGLGSVLGGLAGWIIGFAFWAVVGGFFFAHIPGVTEENFAKVRDLYQANAFLALLGAAFTPIPFKVFTISAGVFEISLWILLVASTIGRLGRFMLVAAFIYAFGPSVKTLLDKYFELATLAFFALLVLGFVVIRYLL